MWVSSCGVKPQTNIETRLPCSGANASFLRVRLLYTRMAMAQCASGKRVLRIATSSIARRCLSPRDDSAQKHYRPPSRILAPDMVCSFPHLAWTFVPVLALRAILFGRVANSLDLRARYLIDAGALVLFAVAAATTAVILQNPGATAFVRSWGVGRGILPAAALAGYGLVAIGLTVDATTVWPRHRAWTPQQAR